MSIENSFNPEQPKPKTNNVEPLAETGSTDSFDRDRFQSPNWNKTRLAADRIFGAEAYEEEVDDGQKPQIEYLGHQVIGRDTRISDGYYIGAGVREIIWVNPNDKSLDLLFHEGRSKLLQIEANGESIKAGGLNVLFNFVRDKLKYDKRKVDQIISASQAHDDKVISLGKFVEGHAGVCRHQGLALAFIVERLIELEVFRGRVSVDRNSIPGLGGHAWVRYTSRAGEISILDPAQNFCDLLKNSVPGKDWNYYRPGETPLKK